MMLAVEGAPQRSNFWGNLIATLRTDLRISQRKLAARAQVDRTTLRRIEADGSSASIHIMEHLLMHLGYELEALELGTRDARLRALAELEQDHEKRAEIAMDRILGMRA